MKKTETSCFNKLSMTKTLLSTEVFVHFSILTVGDIVKKIYLIICFLILTVTTYSQIVYEPIWKDVYNYLDRLSQKGVIEFDDLFKPVPRKYIAEKLNEVKGKAYQLTNLEREELEFFEKDYFIENNNFKEQPEGLENSGFFREDSAKRFRLFSLDNDIVKLNISPIIGYKTSWLGKDLNTHSWNGLYTYGYLPGKIGFSLDFRFNNEKGNSADRYKSFTPVTGIIRNDNKHSFDYSEIESMISVDWKWGNLAVAKEFLEYGYAESGKLVLSNKAPSFPFILLKIKPAKWINFIYFHAWLSSDIIDSVQVAEYKRDIFRSKYFAWHELAVTPWEGLNISIGESIIYSDKLEISYLIPFMFFYVADDYISNRIDKPGDANSQFFLSVSSKNNLKNTHLYGTLFIDELTLRGVGGSIVPDNPSLLFDSDNRLQLGYTVGASVSDLSIDNLSVTLEYTRIYPYVYGHHTPAETYTNASYVMGHWMGHNADLAYLEFNYRFLRGLQMSLWGEYIRKGSSDYSGQYDYPSPPFLFGLKNYYKYLGLNIKYELMHELNFEAGFRLNLTKSEQDDGSFYNDKINEFSLSVYYGL